MKTESSYFPNRTELLLPIRLPQVGVYKTDQLLIVRPHFIDALVTVASFEVSLGMHLLQTAHAGWANR